MEKEKRPAAGGENGENEKIETLRAWLDGAESVIIGAGAGLSTAASPTAASRRYEAFLRENEGKKVLFLELGVGMNTPGIIKYPFWQMTYRNKNARYACINLEIAYAPKEISDRSACIASDLNILSRLHG